MPLSRKSTTAGPCRCRSTTHKRVTHSSCIFNLKNATSLNGEAAKVNPSLDGATCGEAVAHQESLSSAASQSESGINGELLNSLGTGFFFLLNGPLRSVKPANHRA